MKIHSLFFAASAFIASPALAASVVMVQFGSFETIEEANKRLADVKSANAAVLGALPTTVREIKLPPDNLTVYRTQAGPLESRAAAQALCGKLSGSGSECYVVETAVNSAAAVAQAASPISAARSVDNNTTAQPPSNSTAARAPSVIVPEISRSSRMASTITSEPSKDSAQAIVGQPAAAPATSSEMQLALDKAVAAQNAGNLLETPPASVTEAQQRSFWSRVNPFASSEKKPATVTSEVKATAAPLAPVSAATVSPAELPTPVVPTAKATVPELSEKPTASLTNMPEKVTEHSASSVPIVMPMIAVAPVVSNSPESRPKLLPPPPPLTGQDKALLERGSSAAKSVPEAIATPIQASSKPLEPLKPLPAMGDGSVKVEEAKRVPVTETVTSAPLTAAPIATVPPHPNATLGQKTLWAQLGSFSNSDAALTFWETYKKAHPDFPVVRTRVASSIQQQQRGNDRVWLRVGPFAREEVIKNLCSSVDDQNVRCGTVSDLGIAARAGTVPGYLQGSRYKR